MTFGELIDLYLAEGIGHKKPSTLKADRGRIDSRPRGVNQLRSRLLRLRPEGSNALYESCRLLMKNLCIRRLLQAVLPWLLTRSMGATMVRTLRAMEFRLVTALGADDSS